MLSFFSYTFIKNSPSDVGSPPILKDTDSEDGGRGDANGIAAANGKQGSNGSNQARNGEKAMNGTKINGIKQSNGSRGNNIGLYMSTTSMRILNNIFTRCKKWLNKIMHSVTDNKFSDPYPSHLFSTSVNGHSHTILMTFSVCQNVDLFTFIGWMKTVEAKTSVGWITQANVLTVIGNRPIMKAWKLKPWKILDRSSRRLSFRWNYL